HLVLAGARGGHRDAGQWLAWSLRPLDLGAPPLAIEEDESRTGAAARILPGPDVRGVRVVQVGAPGGDDSIDLSADRPTEGRATDAVTGPLGPEAGARTLLDEP